MGCCCNKVVPGDEATLTNVMNEAYSKMSREGVDRAYAERVAHASGYTSEQLQSVPAEAHLGLGCGNPVEAATIEAGETVLDLGSGGGIDVLLAAAKVGVAGQVIGIDNSDEMISRARRNAAAKGLRPPHVAFVKATLTGDLPIESDSVDCILSNRVFNLLPSTGKLKVMQEMYRVLKPGGRVAIDDIVAKKPFPDCLRSNEAMYVGCGCISGAVPLQDYQALMQDTDFKGWVSVEDANVTDAKFASADVSFTENQNDLNVFAQTGCCGTCVRTDTRDLNEWAVACHIHAMKSGDSTAGANSATGSALKNWWDAFPVSVSVSPPSSLECGEVADLIKNPELGKEDFVLVDVRKDDRAGGHIRGSVQQPAQSFYNDLSDFYEEHKDTKQVIFYCHIGNGRGTRCAKWYQDYLGQQGNTTSKAFVMNGGAREWLSAYKEQEDLVEFD